jgi:hypothetical protein
MKSLTILVRCWKNTRKGHFYHTIVILVDGKRIFKSIPHSGAEGQFRTNAEVVLASTGKVVLEDNETLRQYCARNEIAYYEDIVRVVRMKDL